MANKKLPKFGTLSIIPKDREVPFGAVTPALCRRRTFSMTGNCGSSPGNRPRECTRCLTCYLSCPDSCWVYNEKDDVLEWDRKFRKGCQFASHECRWMRLLPNRNSILRAASSVWKNLSKGSYKEEHTMAQEKL